MNLLTDKWLPILRKNGQQEWISPGDITSQLDNAIVWFHANRPDFNAALAQFMIGLLQTIYHPLSDGDWGKLHDKPPTPEELQEKFKPFIHVFNVNDSRSSFMQDFDTLSGESKPISALLIEQPGEQTLKDNKDHFIKRDRINQLCYACAATALFTLQINAPSGGAGHRTSLRGGGPLTTLIVSDNDQQKILWQMLWLNVMPSFSENSEKHELSDIFPWLARTRTSDDKKEGIDTTPRDTSPLQMYWCMPRRIQLNFEKGGQGECHVCHRENISLLTDYITQNYGINYKGGWKHPLSPHYYDKDGVPVPFHPQAGGIPYKLWTTFASDVIAKESGNEKRRSSERAGVLRTLPDRVYNIRNHRLKLWVFGYDMDNMKACCWYEAKMPIFSKIEGLSECAAQLIEAAEEVVKYLRIAIKNAWFNLNATSRGNFDFINLDFWGKTEGNFYKKLEKFSVEIDIDLKEEWLEELQSVANQMFHRHTQSRGADDRRRAKASVQFAKCLHGPKLRGILGLAVIPPSTLKFQLF